MTIQKVIGEIDYLICPPYALLPGIIKTFLHCLCFLKEIRNFINMF